MKNLRYFLYSVLCFVLLTSCEDKIDIDLNEGDARFVIEAQLSDLDRMQRIRISQTVPFTAEQNSKPVSDAIVSVRDGNGRVYDFTYTDNGNYVHRNFLPVANRTYNLTVRIGASVYESQCTMPSYVDVDSVGVVEESIFGDPYYFATFKFNDPKDVANYYKYDVSINGKGMEFASALSDKFDDGLYVTHQIADSENDLTVGDDIVVRRYCVDKAVYKYWNEFQMTNPGTAAPGNPTSNISNKALGYFSVASGKEYTLKVELP
ncbi:DUF4249 domain-containing protein [Sphingobacterium psychroaquaticum]|uniref:Uncharacterized protein n=1 Tax=Sphingobacterium psychroaquaticum TaxID=561061 RepID=A0A1X7HZ91_9SPHI|nr:DUF4249 domain-containing protein [Sphingobacterium psychroaquaticum]QBQ42142.1 DUF4249 domain-containing protein [Sphingobacterium psychroaquaticum]SMG06769.1 protein of unknown function [Sphingobacterium psychroaquaticum]